MDLPIENKCSRQKPCITLTASFGTICLDKQLGSCRSDFSQRTQNTHPLASRKTIHNMAACVNICQNIMWLGMENRPMAQFTHNHRMISDLASVCTRGGHFQAAVAYQVEYLSLVKLLLPFPSHHYGCKLPQLIYGISLLLVEQWTPSKTMY